MTVHLLFGRCGPRRLGAASWNGPPSVRRRNPRTLLVTDVCVGTAYGNGCGGGGPRTRRNTRGRDRPAIGGTLTRENVDRFHSVVREFVAGVYARRPVKYGAANVRHPAAVYSSGDDAAASVRAAAFSPRLVRRRRRRFG